MHRRAMTIALTLTLPAAGLPLCGCGPDESQGCVKDTDCHEPRICDNRTHSCVWPPGDSASGDARGGDTTSGDSALPPGDGPHGDDQGGDFSGPAGDWTGGDTNGGDSTAGDGLSGGDAAGYNLSLSPAQLLTDTTMQDGSTVLRLRHSSLSQEMTGSGYRLELRRVH